MPPRYPFSRAQPGSSSTTTTTTTTTDPSSRTADRPIVVSASGAVTRSPAAHALSADSPSQLRIRIPSPRVNTHANGAANGAANGTSNGSNIFQQDARNYPSPSDSTPKARQPSDLFRKKKSRKRTDGGRDAGGGPTGKGWMKIEDQSPSNSPTRTPTQAGAGGGGGGASGLLIPRYDSRGYPARDKPPDVRYSPETSKAGGTQGRFQSISLSESADSLLSDSSTRAGVGAYGGSTGLRAGDEEAARFLSPDRPTSYYPSSSHGHGSYEGASVYPPSYTSGYAQPQPYPGSSNGHGSDTYVPSIYGAGGGAGMNDSRVSLNSLDSGNSMTHFRKYDALGTAYSSASVTSKGGKRHIAEMFSLPADPSTWSYLGPEADDDFHDPDIKPSRQTRFLSAMMTARGASNLGCLVFLFLLLLLLFCGYPLLQAFLDRPLSTLGGYNLGGTNATGQLPDVGVFQLIDRDTPSSAYTHTSIETGETWNLIFSDEFNNPGRTFYDGDEPYWEAVDLHYWQTNNLEWYDPRAVTTANGSLMITLDKIKTHGLNYQGAMITTWNRFCFTGGYVEASVSLPGTNNVYGLWPAIWAMGNLGRAGYGGTLDGMWPYTYDSCDVGTLPNQTQNGLPEIATTSGPAGYNYSLSYLPGQRLSRCTCPSDTTHPGPKLPNGTFVGRGAPEIDMFEAVVDAELLIGQVSQSAQWAPFDPQYEIINTTSTYSINNGSVTYINTYKGGVYQEASSGISETAQACYTGDTGCFSTYGFEYSPGGTDGYVTWVNDGKQAWTVRGSAMAPNAQTQIGQRLVSEEPMYLIMNLGLSENFGAIDFDGLQELWPVHMLVDYIRVYQDPNSQNIGCDPSNMPTANYISLYPDAYSDPNITTFAQISGAVKPLNSLVSAC